MPTPQFITSIEASVVFLTSGNCATATFVGRGGVSRIVTVQWIAHHFNPEQDAQRKPSVIIPSVASAPMDNFVVSNCMHWEK